MYIPPTAQAVSGALECTCQLTVGEGEKPPVIKPNEPIEGPSNRPITFEVPYTSKLLSLYTVIYSLVLIPCHIFWVYVAN